MTTPEIRLSLTVCGKDVDISAITTAAGVVPNHTWRAGDILQGTKRPQPVDGWEYRTDFQPGYLVGDVLEPVRASTEAQASTLRDLCRASNYDLDLTCIVRMVDETVGLFLTPEQLTWLCELGCTFQVDTYRTALSYDDD